MFVVAVAQAASGLHHGIADNHAFEALVFETAAKSDMSTTSADMPLHDRLQVQNVLRIVREYEARPPDVA